jgi:hypothetical protein
MDRISPDLLGLIGSYLRSSAFMVYHHMFGHIVPRSTDDHATLERGERWGELVACCANERGWCELILTPDLPPAASLASWYDGGRNLRLYVSTAYLGYSDLINTRGVIINTRISAYMPDYNIDLIKSKKISRIHCALDYIAGRNPCSKSPSGHTNNIFIPIELVPLEQVRACFLVDGHIPIRLGEFDSTKMALLTWGNNPISVLSIVPDELLDEWVNRSTGKCCRWWFKIDSQTTIREFRAVARHRSILEYPNTKHCTDYRFIGEYIAAGFRWNTAYFVKLLERSPYYLIGSIKEQVLPHVNFDMPIAQQVADHYKLNDI